MDLSLRGRLSLAAALGGAGIHSRLRIDVFTVQSEVSRAHASLSRPKQLGAAIGSTPYALTVQSEVTRRRVLPLSLGV